MASKRNLPNRYATPTAEQEALQQPAFDPIMLLASLFSGGLTGIGESAGKQALKNQALSSLASVGDPELRDVLGFLADEVPSLLKTTGNATGRAARNFTGANLLANLMNPNHPQANNWLALGNVPEVDVTGAPIDLRRLIRETSPTETPEPTPSAPFTLNPQLLNPLITLLFGSDRALQKTRRQ